MQIEKVGDGGVTGPFAHERSAIRAMPGRSRPKANDRRALVLAAVVEGDIQPVRVSRRDSERTGAPVVVALGVRSPEANLADHPRALSVPSVVQLS